MKWFALLLVSVVILSGCVSGPGNQTNGIQSTGETKTIDEIVASKTLTDFLVDPAKSGSEWFFDTTTGKEILTLVKQDNYAQLRFESDGLTREEIEGKWSIVNDNLIVSGLFNDVGDSANSNNGKTLNFVFSCIKLNIVETDAIEFTAFYNVTESTPTPTCSGESRTYKTYTYQ